MAKLTQSCEILFNSELECAAHQTKQQNPAVLLHWRCHYSLETGTGIALDIFSAGISTLFFFGSTSFELRASHWLGKHSTT
jgi:hypothetical protein